MVRLRKVHRTNSSQGSGPQTSGGTLGDVLYAGRPSRGLAETEWVQLVESVAAGDRLALNRLYVRTSRVVFTLLVRLTSNAAMAEELMVDLYRDFWRGRPRYDRAKGTVLGWIMNQARARALGRITLERRRHQTELRADPRLMAIDGPDYRDLLHAKEKARALQLALLALAPEERSAIELALFLESSASEIGTRLDRLPELVRAQLRSGLHKLRHALRAEVTESLPSAELNPCSHAERVCTHALGAEPAAEAAEIEAHLVSCRSCRWELESLRPVMETFYLWPADVLRPPASVQERLAFRVTVESGGVPTLPVVPERQPDWDDVAPGISCKIFASDAESQMVSMLVRLVPGGEYPPHTHAGVEELHLLHGELWIDDRKLHAGDYNRAEPGTGDKRVWSETGCTCVLVTSALDALS